MDNEKALKHLIGSKEIKKISQAILICDPLFNAKSFLNIIPKLKTLELKQRVNLVAKSLEENFCHDYTKNLNFLIEAMNRGDLKGFELWPISEYISKFGLDHFDESMKAMYFLTQRFTSEFAIRAFLLKDHSKVLKYFNKWANDKNVHVRRWVSEGSRPLLPWGQRIPLFVMDPTHTLHLLDKLWKDDELYVRKSVANHLNDISKNHPDVVINILKIWEKNSTPEEIIKLNWIKKHALRTLIKKGYPKALELLGACLKVDLDLKNLKLNKKLLKLNEYLIFTFEIQTNSKKSQLIIVDYTIDFMRANGSLGKKVFKIKTFELDSESSVSITKKHSFRPITTMKYYSGIHNLSIQINGKVMGKISFNLKT